jgi:hypothetical protein
MDDVESFFNLLEPYLVCIPIETETMPELISFESDIAPETQAEEDSNDLLQVSVEDEA